MSAKKIVAAGALLFGLLASASAEPQNSFLQLKHEERYWWINGAVLTLAHYVSVTDKPKGECISSWYLKDRAARQKLIEDSIAQYPNEIPTTIVFGLLTRTCGKLFPS